MSRRQPGPKRSGRRLPPLPTYWAPVTAGVAVGMAIGLAFSSPLFGVAAGITVAGLLAWEQRHFGHHD